MPTIAAEVAALSWFGGEGEIAAENHLLAQGYNAITDLLARGLDIRLREGVRAVRFAGSGVVVATATEAFFADRVVCTLPRGLRERGEVEFDPPLPAAHAGAIARIGKGLLDKIVLASPASSGRPSRTASAPSSKPGTTPRPRSSRCSRTSTGPSSSPSSAAPPPGGHPRHPLVARHPRPRRPARRPPRRARGRRHRLTPAPPRRTTAADATRGGRPP